MTRKPWLGSLASTLLGATLLAGCHLEPLEQQDPIELVTHHTFDHANWRQLPPVVENQVEPITLVHAVDFAPGERGLREDERQALLVFLQESGVYNGARVEIDGPRGAGGYHDPVTATRMEAIRRSLAELGLQAQVLAKPATLLAKPDGQIVVTVTRAMVILPDCTQPQPDLFERPQHTWSCSTAANLGLMVVDPVDLERGRSPGPADGTASVLAIQRYRKGEVKPLDNSSITSQ